MKAAFIHGASSLALRPSRYVVSCSSARPSGSGSASDSASAAEAGGNVEGLSPSPAAARHSALDDLPASIKLNAVAEAVAKRKDHAATLRLLSEMNQQGVPLERSTQTTLVNASVDDHTQLSAILASISPRGYGMMSDIPQSEQSFGPVDPSRPLDLSLAAGFVTVVSTALSVEVFEPTLLHHPADEATATLIFVGLVLAADRYALSAAMWRHLKQGLTRLFSHDPARVALADAAAFLVGYLLGLPWFCYRPDGRRAARWRSILSQSASEPHPAQLLATASRPDSDNTPPHLTALEESVVAKCLLWLVAPVAAELAVDNTLIISDLSPARDFMSSVRSKLPAHQRPPARDTDSRIYAAVSAASALLLDYKQAHSALTDAFLSGASAGECVTLMSDRFIDIPSQP